MASDIANLIIADDDYYPYPAIVRNAYDNDGMIISLYWSIYTMTLQAILDKNIIMGGKRVRIAEMINAAETIKGNVTRFLRETDDTKSYLSSKENIVESMARLFRDLSSTTGMLCRDMNTYISSIDEADSILY